MRGYCIASGRLSGQAADHDWKHAVQQPGRFAAMPRVLVKVLGERVLGFLCHSRGRCTCTLSALEHWCEVASRCNGASVSGCNNSCRVVHVAWRVHGSIDLW